MIVKKFDKEKDDPNFILGVACRDSITGQLYVIDRTTGIKIIIVEEEEEAKK